MHYDFPIISFIYAHWGVIDGALATVCLVAVRVWPPPEQKWLTVQTAKTFFFDFTHQITHQDPKKIDLIPTGATQITKTDSTTEIHAQEPPIPSVPPVVKV